jgi:hypothetical protein
MRFYESNKTQIERDLRSRVVQQADVTLSDVRFVDEHWIIKTSSGKIACSDNRAKYLHCRVITKQKVKPSVSSTPYP